MGQPTKTKSIEFELTIFYLKISKMIFIYFYFYIKYFPKHVYM